MLHTVPAERKSMNRKETDEKVTVIQPQKDIMEDMEANLSDFALFLTVMKRRRAYRNILSIIL